MIEIICGEKGTGKTKRIISLANGISDQAKGSMVFIDDDNSYMYDVRCKRADGCRLSCFCARLCRFYKAQRLKEHELKELCEL